MVAPTSTVGPASAGKPLICAALLILIFIRKRLKHRQSRLGCRLNAGFAQWAEPHGCGESAVRTWMSVRRGPTERDRSEGTRRSRAQPGAGPFWLLFRLLEKVTRRKGGTIIPAHTNNGYTPNLRKQKRPRANHSANGLFIASKISSDPVSRASATSPQPTY